MVKKIRARVCIRYGQCYFPVSFNNSSMRHEQCTYVPPDGSGVPIRSYFNLFQSTIELVFQDLEMKTIQMILHNYTSANCCFLEPNASDWRNCKGVFMSPDLIYLKRIYFFPVFHFLFLDLKTFLFNSEIQKRTK